MRLTLSSRSVRHRFALLIMASGSLLCLGFGPPVLTDGGTPALRLFPHQVEALSTLPLVPSISAESALLADVRSGMILFQEAAQESRPPASTTKIMTALLALEKGNLGDLVEVPADALVVGEASMGLVAGEQLTLEDLLYGLLLVSGNDAALTVAIHVGGSVSDFVALMNDRAAELGMTRTHFANPHGLDELDHFSSAADLLMLSRKALENPAFARIVSTSEVTVAGHYLANTNELLSTYRGSDGVKTGTTDAAGECLVGSATGEGGRAIVVVLASQDRYSDAKALLDYYADNYSEQELALPLNRLRDYEDGQGRTWILGLAEQKATLLPRWQLPLVQVFRWIEADVQMAGGQPKGVARFTLGSSLLAEVPLTASPRE